MADGKIVFNTALDNKNLAADLKKAERDIAKAQNEISKSKQAKIPLLKQADELVVKLDNAKAKLYELQKEQAKIAATMQNGNDPIAYMDAAARKKDNDAAVVKQQKETDVLQKKWDGVVDKVDAYNEKIKNAEIALKNNQIKAGQLTAKMSSGGVKMAEAMEVAALSAKKFGHRILMLGKRVFIFTMITQALRKVRQYMGGLLRSNQQYQQELANIKGNLMTAFQPLYEFILPAVLAVLKVINAIAAVLANVISAIFGKTAKQSAENAKNLNKEAQAIGGVGQAAKDAQKSLASFDEINKLDAPDTGGGVGGGGGISPNFDQFSNDDFKQKIDALTAILSGALLVIGAILAFSGIDIPRGIALMAIGAIGLVAVAKENWNLIVEKLKGPIGQIVGVASAALLVLGLILTFGGVSLPLGIALIAVGAAGLATVVTLNWDAIINDMQGEFGILMTIISGALLVLGILLLFTGAGTALGVGLILAGAAGLAAEVAVNWDFITEKLKNTWEDIKRWWTTEVWPKTTYSYWMSVFDPAGEGMVAALKNAVNVGIKLINDFTGWISNVLSFDVPGFSIAGKQIFGGFSTHVQIPEIPYLAKGAVLPPNQPFMAMVGDQKRGTNVEAPLDTIKEAVTEVLVNNPQIDIMREGVELLKMILERCGLYIDGKELASVVSRYQRQSSRAYGG